MPQSTVVYILDVSFCRNRETSDLTTEQHQLSKITQEVCFGNMSYRLRL